jgi:hypothetical protein
MSSLAIQSFNGQTIRIRKEDRYVSLTDMAKASGKEFKHWNSNLSSKSYIATLSSVVGIPTTELVEVNQGGIPESQGTWGHPKVALRFAQWCSDEFAVQVDFWIDELVTTGKVEIVQEKPKSTISAYEGLNMLRESLLNCVAPPLVEGIIINGIGRICPEIEPEVKAAHKLLAATTESEILLTPTSIGERLGISNRKVNSILVNMGYQVKNVNAKKGEPAYLATPKGIPHAANTIATGNMGDDSSYQHLKWKESIIEVLESQLVAA